MLRLPLAALLPLGAAAWDPWSVPLRLLPEGTTGRCLDGSPGGYYLDFAKLEEYKNKWVFFLQGGGECTDYSACHFLMGSWQGSSRHFGATLGQHETGGLFYTSGDPNENPFADWNRVYLPYCSQDVWSGTRDKASSETFGLYFAGHLIVGAVLAELLKLQSLQEATDLVFGGMSAGGIGSWLNMDFVYKQLPSLRKAILAPVAGFYGFSTTYTGPGATRTYLPDFSEEGWRRYIALWQAHVEPNCEASMPSELRHTCMLANYSAPTFPYAVFVVQAQTDQVQLTGHSGFPGQPLAGQVNCHDAGCFDFLKGWSKAMVGSLHARLKPTDGYFLPACFTHVGFCAAGPLLPDEEGRPVSYLQATARFYEGDAVRLEDTCGLLCGRCAGALPGRLLARGVIVA